MKLAILVVAALAVQVAGCTSGPLADRVSQPGSAAKKLIDPAEHAKLLVEIDHPEGYGPNEEALAVLKSTLVEVSGRAAADVEIRREASIPVEGSKKYTYDEIAALEDKHRSSHTRGDTAALYIVYVAGGSAVDDNEARVLGAAYRGTSLVIFKGNIREGTKSGLLGTAPEERYVERAVLVHELGHALGLVNLGTPMVRDHEDKAHGEEGRGHSANERSVMYYNVDTSNVLLNVISGGANIPFQFDADDKADLRALRS